MKFGKKKSKKNKSKHLNILLFNDIEAKPKKFKLSKKIIKFSLGASFALFICGIVGLTIFSQKYLESSKKLVSFDALKKETSHQKIQIEQFAKKLEELKTKFVKLENYDKKLRAITALKSNSNTKKVEKWSVGGPDLADVERLSDIISKNSNSVLTNLHDELNLLSLDLDQQLVSYEELNTFFKDQSTLLSAIPTVWPVKGWITSSFGYRRSPFTGGREVHEGLDIATNTGSEVIAPADGIVVRAGTERGYGNMLEIDHGYGYITKFGHNSEHFVKVGEKVKRGQLIAKVGNTGRSTGPHLHYEIILNGIPVDPLKYILDE